LALELPCADEGNIHLLHVTATPGQRANTPAVGEGDGPQLFSRCQSCPGAGSTLGVRTTRARVAGRLGGLEEKHLISGADGRPSP